MIVSISQPAYLPWLGYFHRIAVSDLHVVLDHIQLEKNSKSFTHRNKVRTRESWCWLTVPIKTKGNRRGVTIEGAEIVEGSDWAKTHWETLRIHYGRAPHFKEHAAFFETLYARPWTRLNDLMREITGYLLQCLGIGTPLRFSSEMKVGGAKDELILNLCRATDATFYLSGPLGRNYLREPLFRESGIRVGYQDYHHPSYPQVFPGFEPYLSVVDLLFNCGARSLDVLMSGNTSKASVVEG